MCRWIAYQGSPIFLEDLLLKPEHSLIDQSRRARDPGDLDQPSAGDPAFYMNGDGVGVGWYGERTTPGVYRDILPAWNDKNLENLAEQIRSGLFLAHIRASSGGAIQKTNCHPFRHRRWLLQHNGQINESRV